METKQPLQDRVNAALDAAVFENGYRELMTQTPFEVAVDLCDYSPEVEDEDVKAVTACVKDYQKWFEENEAHRKPRCEDQG